MDLEDLAYYRQRAQVERSHAAEATNPHARQIHLELASLYVQLIELKQVEKPKLSVVSDRLTA